MMEYQGKHKEACAKFESIEEEHLAQMVTFTIQLASALEANVTNVDKVSWLPFPNSSFNFLINKYIYAIYLVLMKLYSTLHAHMQLKYTRLVVMYVYTLRLTLFKHLQYMYVCVCMWCGTAQRQLSPARVCRQGHPFV